MKTLALLLLAVTACAQIRINAGGAAVTDHAGVAWQADSNFTGGAAFAATPGVAEPLGTVRYGLAGSAFSYSFSVPMAGKLRLHFREQWVMAIGGRVFSVLVNGTPVLTNFDIFATSGLAPLVREFDVVGQVRVDFTASVRNAIVSAIEIIVPPAPAPGSKRFNEKPTGPIDGNNLVFQLAETPLRESLELYNNGLHLWPGVDYTLTGKTVVFVLVAAPQELDDIRAVYEF